MTAQTRKPTIRAYAAGPLAAAVILILAVTGCAPDRPEVSVQTGDNDREPKMAFVEPDDSEDPGAAFDFAAPELFTGEMVSGQELFTDAPTIITFIDPNCPVCVSEGPKLAEAAAEHPGVNFVVVHGYSNAQAYAGFVHRSDLHTENMVHLVDTEGVLTNRYNLLFQPSSLLVNGSGQMTVAAGSLGVEGINEAVAIITDT